MAGALVLKLASAAFQGVLAGSLTGCTVAGTYTGSSGDASVMCHGFTSCATAQAPSTLTFTVAQVEGTRNRTERGGCSRHLVSYPLHHDNDLVM